MADAAVQPSLHAHVHDVGASGATHAKGQQHPIKLYLVVWGWLFVLSTCSYLVDYFGLHGYLRWSLILTFMVMGPTVKEIKANAITPYLDSKITQKQAEDVARAKLPDLNTKDLGAATQMVMGTARSMGIEITK